MYAGGIVGKQRRDGGPRRIWNGVEFEPVEADEQVVAVETKHAPRFLMRADLVGVRHHAELADDEVEALIVERQFLCVRRLEGHAGERSFCAATPNITGFRSVATIRFGGWRLVHSAKGYAARSSGWVSDHLRIRVSMYDAPPAIVAPEDLCHA